MVINVWLEHSYRPVGNGVSIFLKTVTQLQSMYKACSVSKVPTAIVFLASPLFCGRGYCCNRGNMQQMVQQPVDHVIWGTSLCSVVMIVETVMQKSVLCCVVLLAGTAVS